MVQNEENVLLSKEEYDKIVVSLMHEMVDEDPAPGIRGTFKHTEHDQIHKIT